jgi:hypothetical protein
MRSNKKGGINLLQLTNTNNYKVDRANQRLSQNQPVYSYKPTHRGQAAFIIARCEDEGIYAKYEYGAVRIYAKSKLNKFQEVIKEAITMHRDQVGLNHNVHKYKTLHNHCFCVGVKSEDCLYTYERVFDKIVVYQFLGKIALTKNVKIFTSYDEFYEQMLMKGVVITK